MSMLREARDFETRDYKIFEMFKKNWALVSAGTTQDFNALTVSWGAMGTLWTSGTKGGNMISVFAYPTRFTCDYLKKSNYFTVSFFNEAYRRALAYMGTHSGKHEDKVSGAGLHTCACGDNNESVTYEEARLTFLCRKIYQHHMRKEDIAHDILDYYASDERSYPRYDEGEWQPHWQFIGEIVSVWEKD